MTLDEAKKKILDENKNKVVDRIVSVKVDIHCFDVVVCFDDGTSSTLDLA